MTSPPSPKANSRKRTHTALPPPTPSFIFRGHDAPIHSLKFFASNAFLMTGDELGWICVWDVWKRRQVYKWHAHPSGSVLELLAIPYRSTQAVHLPTPNDTITSPAVTRHQALSQHLSLSDHYLVSHGRDYEIHVWDISTILKESIKSGSSLSPASSSSTQTPKPVFSLPVNALNFCKMSILAIEHPEGQKWSNDTPFGRTHQHIYIAVPSPTSTAMVDVYDIVKPERTFASVGLENKAPSISAQDKKWGAAMGIRLFRKKDTTDSTGSESLHMLVGYEDGSMTLFREQAHAKSKRSMEVVWTIKCHREPVMAMDVTSDHEYAVSCSSDSLLVKYKLVGQPQGVPETMQVPLKTTGVSDVKFRNDNRILALAGWDGKIRVFSAKSLKPLAVLQYHREGLYCLGFANVELKREDRVESNAETMVENQDVQDDPNKVVPSSSLASQDAETQNLPLHSAIDNDGQNQDNENGSEDSEDSDSDLEDSLRSRVEWSRRHWLAAGGKENRISLWEIY